MNDLTQRTVDSFNQLTRYGSVPYCEELVIALEILADINDDLWHGRNPSLTLENTDRVRWVLDRIDLNLGVADLC